MELTETYPFNITCPSEFFREVEFVNPNLLGLYLTLRRAFEESGEINVELKGEVN